MEGVQVCGLPAKFILIGFFVANTTVLALIVISLLAGQWVESKDPELWFNGNIYQINESALTGELSYFGAVVQTKVYMEETTDAGEDPAPEAYAVVTFFSILALSSLMFILCAGLSLLSLLASILLYGLSLARGSLVKGLSIPVILTVLFYSTGFLIFILLNYITFSEDCYKFNDGKDPLYACARTGPKIALTVFVIYLVCAVFHWIYCAKLKRALANSYSAFPNPQVELPYYSKFPAMQGSDESHGQTNVAPPPG